MKKHLIAAAVAAAVAVPAMAQVTVSGVLDVRAIGSGKATATTAAGVVTNTKTSNTSGTGGGATAVSSSDGWSTSQIVFSGTEDLGGGLKASFFYSQRLGDALTLRDRYLDLAGGFGSVRVGRFNNILDSAGLIQGYGTTLTPGASNFVYTAVHDRQSGLIQYTSPTLNGFTGIVGFANNSSDLDNAGGKQDTKQTYVGVTYNQGPLSLVAATSERKIGAENAAGTVAVPNPQRGDSDFDIIGGSFNFGVARLHAGHMKVKVTNTSDVGVNTTINDLKVNTFGVTVPMGAFTFRASVFDGKDGQGAAATDDLDVEGNQLSVTYALSKRTLVYLASGVAETKAKQPGTVAVPTTASLKRSGTNLGISHSF